MHVVYFSSMAVKRKVDKKKSEDSKKGWITRKKNEKKTVSKKTAAKKPKPKGEVIPKLEIEKPHPRKLPVPMPPGLSKVKSKKTTKKTTAKKKK